MFRLRVLGSLDLCGPNGEALLPVLAQPKRVALLCYLAIASPGSFHRRDKLVGLFWPKSDHDHARASLRRALSFLRHWLGEEVIVSRGNEEVALAPDSVWCDAVAFGEALEQAEFKRAVEFYAGPLLDGFHLKDAGELEHWLESNRQRLAGQYARALESLAEGAEVAKDHRGAVDWWMRLADHDPYNSAYLVRLTEALVAAGDPANALQHALEHERLLKEELGMEPAPEVASLAQRLREDARRGAEERSVEEGAAKEYRGAAAPRRLVSRHRLSMFFGVAVASICVGVVGWLLLLKPSASEPDRPMLAVLPFENLGTPEDRYIAIGLAEEVSARLAGIRAFGVIDQRSARQVVDTEKDVGEMGDELGVDYVLAGTVLSLCSGEEQFGVRVTVRLVRVSDRTHVWGAVHDQVCDDFFKIASLVAEDAARNLNITLAEVERSLLAARPTDNSLAYEYYLRARDYRSRPFSRHNLYAARDLLDEAVRLDPGFALAHAWLSLVSMSVWWSAIHTADTVMATARTTAVEALRLDPDLPDAHLAMGVYQYVCCADYERAVEHLERTTHWSEGLLFLGNVRKRQGRWEEALEAYERALVLEPDNAWLPYNSVHIYMWLRQFEDAEREIQRLQTIDPQMADMGPLKAWLWLLREGNTRRARESLLDYAALVGRDSVFPAMNSRVSMFQREYEDAATWAAGGFGSAPYLANEVENRITRATIHRLMGEGTLALAHFDSARVAALRELRPGMANKRLECDLRAHLAVAYAGLGQREQALQEAEALLGLDPLAVDAWWGSNWLLDLAEMNVLLGERDSAIDLLEQVLSMPSRLTVPLLELDPLWDPLRDHARFQELLTREP